MIEKPNYITSLFFLIFTALFSSCDEESVVPQENPETVNEFIYQQMTDVYLWADQVTDTPDLGVEDPQILLDELIYEPIDRYTFITNTKEITDFFEEGKRGGLGIRISQFQDGFYLATVFKDSPAGLAGMERGMKLTRVNDFNVLADNDNWLAPFNDNELGNSINITVLDNQDSVRTFDLQFGEYVSNTVLFSQVIDTANQKIGHIVFTDFLETSEEELEAVFDNFKQENVTKTVIDLRYNGGGFTRVAKLIASNMAPTNVSDGKNIFYSYELNQKYDGQLDPELFLDNTNEFAKDGLVILTSSGTASASELVIAGLKPYIDVKTVGKKTYGKPVGSIKLDHEESGLSLFPIIFKTVNKDGFSDYFQGIPADIEAIDNVSKPFTDLTEDGMQSALAYLIGGNLSIQSNARVGYENNNVLYEEGQVLEAPFILEHSKVSELLKIQTLQ
jgi:C-terminal processing protease CtpA/Prc